MSDTPENNFTLLEKVAYETSSLGVKPDTRDALIRELVAALVHGVGSDELMALLTKAKEAGYDTTIPR